MKNTWDHGAVAFHPSGLFSRIGDYFSGKAAGLPFSAQIDGIGKFGGPEFKEKKDHLELDFRDDRSKTEVRCVMDFDEKTRIISRRDTVRNCTEKPLMLRKWLARFPLHNGEYEVMSSRSRWCAEGMDKWQPLHSGSLTLNSRAGRYCEGSVPFAALRDSYSAHALGFMVFPEGDWVIRFSSGSEYGRLPWLTVEAGLSDESLELELAPSETWEAPEVLIQILPDRESFSGAAMMDRYLNGRFPYTRGHAPMVYNTWLDRFSELNVPRLLTQLQAAKECGCEVFVVDYGWYEDHHAFCRLDDWDECQDRAFYGKMKNFSDTVRAAGLGFGFWVEMEFFSAESKVVKKHPGWFFQSEFPEQVCPKTWLKEVEDYMVASLAGKIRQYQAVYVKNDMNHSQGFDPAHLNRYQTGFARIMARLRKECPEVTFDNCASGSARMAAGSMLRNFDIHFISDNATPLENLHMLQNMFQRVPPGRIFHWYVGSEVHPEKDPAASFEAGQIFQPHGASWRRLQTEDLDFGLLCNMMGPWGFSCDLASYSAENRKKMAKYTAFYKKYRDSFLRAEAHLLTAPEDFEKQRGWLALQLTDPQKDLHFLHIFHCICDGDADRVFHPAGLVPGAKYKAVQCFPEKGKATPLPESGLAVHFDLEMLEGFRGQLFLIRRKGRASADNLTVK